MGSCYGSTGPAGEGDGFPPITTRDQARAACVLLEVLRIPRVLLVTGGSLGGMVALEFVASFPRRARAAVVFAAPAATGASALGWVHVQRELLRTAGEDGLALARQVAMLTYRTPVGLQQRFGRRRDSRGEFAVREWLRVHGERLTARFSRASYLALLDAMDAHDLGRGRAGVAERLRASGARLTGVGITGDQFFPAAEVAEWVAAAGGAYRTIESAAGHDAFLIERDQVAAILREALGDVLPQAHADAPSVGHHPSRGCGSR
jgi:homoserine O-acetyltransferase